MRGTMMIVGCSVLLASCQTAQPPAVEAPNPRLAQLEDENARWAARYTELEGKIADLNAARDGLSTDQAQSARERQDLLRDRDALLSKTGQLEFRLKGLETDLLQTRDQLDRAQRLAKELADDRDQTLKTGAAGASELQKSLRAALADKERLADRVAQLEAERDALSRQLKQDAERLDAAAAQLKRSLKVEIDKGNVDVVQYQNVLAVNIKDSLLFGPDSPLLKPDYKPLLATIGQAFRAFPDKVIRVEGHTAVAPSKWSSSWDLGAARAVAVVQFLQVEQRIDPARLLALSFGEFRPLAPNLTEEGRSKNRRVELVLVDRPLYQVQELIRSGTL